MELFQPVDFFQKVKPICMPQSTTEKYDFDDAHLAGWGYNGRNVDSKGRLRAVSTSIWPQWFCEKILRDAPTIFNRPGEQGRRRIRSDTVDLRQSPRPQSVQNKNDNN